MQPPFLLSAIWVPPLTAKIICVCSPKMYIAEIKNLDRILESLVRSGMIPSGFSVPSTAVSGYP